MPKLIDYRARLEELEGQAATAAARVTSCREALARVPEGHAMRANIALAVTVMEQDARRIMDERLVLMARRAEVEEPTEDSVSARLLVLVDQANDTDARVRNVQERLQAMNLTPLAALDVRAWRELLEQRESLRVRQELNEMQLRIARELLRLLRE
jgi:hypothetical protein